MSNPPIDRRTGEPATVYTPPEDLLVTPSDVPIWSVTYYVYGRARSKDMTSGQIAALILMFEGLGSTGFDIRADRIV